MLKIAFTIVFACLLWVGITLTGRDKVSLNNQATAYVANTKEVLVRFHVLPTGSLPVASTLSKQGSTLKDGQLLDHVSVTLQNLSDRPLMLKVVSSIQPEAFAEHINVQLAWQKPILLEPKGQLTSQIKVSSSAPTPQGSEIAHITLQVSPAEEGTHAKR